MINEYIGKLYTVCEWIMRIAYVNLLWFLFTFAGLIILGITPATTAMFSITGKWLEGQSDIAIFKTFWRIYKEEFWKSQKYGFILIVVGLILFVDYKFFTSPKGYELIWLKYMFLILIWLYVNMIFYFFSLYSKYKLSIKTYFKNAILLSIFNPIHNLIMILGCVFMILFVINFPGLSPFFSISLVGLWVSVITRHVLKKVELKKKIESD